MTSVSRFLAGKLRLKVNEAKSAVARPEERKFLGFSIANDGSERRIAPKALATFKTRIREMTRRTRGISLPQVIEELRPYLIGWRGYFGFCQTPRELTKLEAWIRRRLRMYLWRQWQNGHNRFKELIPFRKCNFVSILSFRLTFVLMAGCWSPSRPRHNTTMGSRPDAAAWRGSANRAEGPR